MLRSRIARVRNAILALAAMNVAVYDVTIADVYASSMELGLSSKSMRNPDVMAMITQTAMTRRNKLMQGSDEG